jgi:hypothetical protein
MFLFGFIAILLIAVYLFMPSPNTETPAAASLKDFNFPDNSIGKPVPRLYGMARLYGNCIYVGGLRTEEIKKCT